MRGSALCIAAVLLAAPPAAALEEANFRLANAADLAALCGAAEAPLATQMCYGYLAGADHAHTAVRDSLGEGVYCLPQDGSVTRASAAADFSRWMAEHPELSQDTAMHGLMSWANSAYPCPAE